LPLPAKVPSRLAQPKSGSKTWVKDAYDSARNIIAFRCPERADRFGFFPGVRRTDSTIVQFEHADFFEVLRFLPFAL